MRFVSDLAVGHRIKGEIMSRELGAEFIGTFALVFVGMMAIATGADRLGVALAHGFTIAVMASATNQR